MILSLAQQNCNWRKAKAKAEPLIFLLNRKAPLCQGARAGRSCAAPDISIISLKPVLSQVHGLHVSKCFNTCCPKTLPAEQTGQTECHGSAGSGANQQNHGMPSLRMISKRGELFHKILHKICEGFWQHNDKQHMEAGCVSVKNFLQENHEISHLVNKS